MANEWSDEQCAKYLAACLVGDAAHTLALRDDYMWTFGELFEALDERYGQTGSQFLVRSKLRRIKQAPNQGLQSLADEIVKLVRVCAHSQREHDRLAVDSFIEALNDSEVRRHLLEDEPINIQGALRRAKRFYDIQMASRAGLRNPRAFATENMPDNNHALLAELEQLRMRQGHLEQELHAARQMNQGYPNRGRGGNNLGGQDPRFQSRGPGDTNNPRGSDNPDWRSHGPPGQPPR